MVQVATIARVHAMTSVIPEDGLVLARPLVMVVVEVVTTMTAAEDTAAEEDLEALVVTEVVDDLLLMMTATIVIATTGTAMRGEVLVMSTATRPGASRSTQKVIEYYGLTFCVQVLDPISCYRIWVACALVNAPTSQVYGYLLSYLHIRCAVLPYVVLNQAQ